MGEGSFLGAIAEVPGEFDHPLYSRHNATECIYQDDVNTDRISYRQDKRSVLGPKMLVMLLFTLPRAHLIHGEGLDSTSSAPDILTVSTSEKRHFALPVAVHKSFLYVPR